MKRRMRMDFKRMVGAIIAGVLLIVTIAVGIMSTTVIPPGYVGVVYSINGGIQGDVMTQGWHIVAPWYKITKYSVATEQGYMSADEREGSSGDDSFLIPTSDGKTVNVDLEYSYHFDVEKLPVTFTKFKGQSGKDIEHVFMRGKLKTWAGEVSSKFSVLDIYGAERSELNRAVLDHVRAQFDDYGIIIDSIAFSRIGLDAQTEQAIQQRVNAQQALEFEKIETEKALQIAEKRKVEAKGAAEAALIEAKGKAERVKINAEAEAAANRLIASSMTPELLKKMEMEARKDHGWITIQGAGNVIADATK